MHLIANQKKYNDRVFAKNLYFLLLPTLFASNKRDFYRHKKRYLKIANISAHYYASILSDCREISKVLSCLSRIKVIEKNESVFCKVCHRFFIMKTKLDGLAEERGKECLFYILDQSDFLYCFKDVLLKPNYSSRTKNFKNYISFARKKGVPNRYFRNFEKSLVELDDLVNVYVKNYKIFKKTNDIHKSNLSFRELNWAAYSLIGFWFRWDSIYSKIGYYDANPVLRHTYHGKMIYKTSDGKVVE